MKWGLQHVKVTLEESDSGEVVVIEQSSDGRITCVPARGGRVRAANSAPRRGAKRGAGAAKDSAPAEEHEEATVEPEAEAVVAPKAADKRKTHAKAKATKKPSSGESKSGRRDTALAWEPVRDHDYEGFAAGSAAGQFKALITKGSQWALFYELRGTWPKHVGCFRTEAKAKERAQELHDAGWPESEFGPVTAGQVATACPAPEPSGEQGNTPRMKRKTKAEKKEDAVPTTEEKPTVAPTAEPASKADTEKDKALLASLKSELGALLDEKDD